MNVEFLKNFEKQNDSIRDSKLKDEIAGVVCFLINVILKE